MTTYGSHGDLHPFLAVAVRLQQRGHTVVLATSEVYRTKVAALGLGFVPIRPDHPDFTANPGLMAYFLHRTRGPERLVRELMMPALRQSYADLDQAVRPGDVLVTQSLTYAARLVAEARGLPWVATALQPVSMFSAADQPVLAPAPWVTHLRWLGPRFYRLLFGAFRLSIKSWSQPWHRLRQDLGLPATKDDPLLTGHQSPYLTLALFSRLLGPPRADWPARTVLTGFPWFFEEGSDAPLPPGLASFLDCGPPPLVFTLGTMAVRTAGDFYETSLTTARRLGYRALLITATGAPVVHTGDSLSVPYAPYAQVFPRAAVIIHHGGIGTTAQGLRAGRPALVVPFALDQPDHGDRLVRMGVGLCLPRARYRADRAASALARLLYDPSFREKARSIGSAIGREDGASVAAAALESLLART